MEIGRARSPTVESIVSALLAHLDDDMRADLRSEDPAAAIELYFGPVGFQPLPSTRVATGQCATDGYYDSQIDPSQPWIIYANDVHETRIRFTILHELGHHLLVTAACTLLEDIDVLGAGDAIHTEEAICHRFAGKLLLPDELLTEIISGERIKPEHVIAVHERAAASWEAVAVRVAEVMPTAGAVILLRDGETVAFCASSPRLGSAWWPRDSRLASNGPLARGLHLQQKAVPEQYRFGLGYARAMFCDTLPVHEGLAIGVLSEKPSDGSLSIIEEVEPAWKGKVEFCEWHPGVERDVGWCYKCKGRRCPECGRCGCTHPVKNPLCPACGLLKPFRTGATVCLDCED